MGIFNFINSGFLIGGLIAAGIPVLIHLLLRQRAREVTIGSVRFLKAVLQQHTRRRRIRQWILLALRTLAVLLLAALFARPWLDRSQMEGFNREVVVLIDRSASMQLQAESDDSLFDQAIQQARQEVDNLDEHTALHVGVFDSSGVEDVTKSADLAETRAGFSGTDFGKALAWARDILVVSDRPQRQVILISDLQQSGIDRTAVSRFPDAVELIVRDVGRNLSENLAITDCRCTASEIRPGEPVRVQARLSNSHPLPAEDVQLKLTLNGPNGEVTSEQTVTVEGGDVSFVEFELELEKDGIYSGSVVMDRDDDVPFDNLRWIAFEARHPDRVLLVDGQPGSSVYTNETYYLETALRLRASGQALSALPGRSYEVERIVWDDGDGFPRLDVFRAVILANVGRLTATDAKRLRTTLTAGGNVLMFCGDRTRADQIDNLREAGLLNARLSRTPATGRLRIVEWEQKHPLFQPFDDPQNGDLRRLVFRRQVRLVDVAEPARTLAATAEAPLIVEQEFGRGRLLLVATPVDRDWSDWPQRQLFVPMVRQMLASVTGQTGQDQTIREESPVPGTRPGIENSADGVVLVRNCDPLESQLDRVSEEDFRAAYGLRDRDRTEVLAELAESIEAPPGSSREEELWRAVVWLLLGLLAIELLLSSRVHA